MLCHMAKLQACPFATSWAIVRNASDENSLCSSEYAIAALTGHSYAELACTSDYICDAFSLQIATFQSAELCDAQDTT